MVGKKSEVMTVSQLSRATGPTTAGHAMMPGTRCPPSQMSRFLRKQFPQPSPLVPMDWDLNGCTRNIARSHET